MFEGLKCLEGLMAFLLLLAYALCVCGGVVCASLIAGCHRKDQKKITV
jgi:hypothetical protein